MHHFLILRKNNKDNAPFVLATGSYGVPHDSVLGGQVVQRDAPQRENGPSKRYFQHGVWLIRVLFLWIRVILFMNNL